MRSFDVSLICIWINSWVNDGKAGDLRRHGTHYDVIVMYNVYKEILGGVCLQSGPGRAEQVPENKVHGANMGPIWGRQDPGGPHVGPMNFAIWGVYSLRPSDTYMHLYTRK